MYVGRCQVACWRYKDNLQGSLPVALIYYFCCCFGAAYKFNSCKYAMHTSTHSHTHTHTRFQTKVGPPQSQHSTDKIIHKYCFNICVSVSDICVCECVCVLPFGFCYAVLFQLVIMKVFCACYRDLNRLSQGNFKVGVGCKITQQIMDSKYLNIINKFKIL